MKILYNEFEPNAAQWLKNLSAEGLIPQGEVDERSITEIAGQDLVGVKQFHTFAGIGGWPLALKLAGWPVDREVWSGSCPCQPFSQAGKKTGIADKRHLWPDFFRLIAERRPGVVFGEQVASSAGLGWLDGVFADLEREGYSCGAAIVGAHSVGAPHIRQRLYWVADRGVEHDAQRLGRDGRSDGDSRGGAREVQAPRLGSACGMGDGGGDDLGRLAGSAPRAQAESDRSGGEDGPCDFVPGSASDARGLADGKNADGGTGERGEKAGAGSNLLGGRRSTGGGDPGGMGDPASLGPQRDGEGVVEAEMPERGHELSPWSDYRIIPCTDGKARRTGARVFPLAHGIPRGVDEGRAWRKGLARGASRARLGMLKGSGNAILPTLAADFVRAYMQARGVDTAA